MQPMPPMPKLKRARGGLPKMGKRTRADGFDPMPPMPGKDDDIGTPDDLESRIYGGGIRAMRANVARMHGFGPNEAIEPEIDKGERNWITPMGVPNFTKMSRDVRYREYSGGRAAERLAPMLKAMREREEREANSLDWNAVMEWAR